MCARACMRTCVRAGVWGYTHTHTHTLTLDAVCIRRRRVCSSCSRTRNYKTLVPLNRSKTSHLKRLNLIPNPRELLADSSRPITIVFRILEISRRPEGRARSSEINWRDIGTLIFLYRPPTSLISMTTRCDAGNLANSNAAM